MRLGELLSGVPGVAGVIGDADVLRVVEDSRVVRAGDVFVARGGTKVSGAAFAAQAIERGATAVVSEEPLDVPAGVAWARVGNANLALAIMAHRMAGDPTRTMPVLGVTGTKGKTTVAYLLRSIINAGAGKAGMIGTVEIDDGVDRAEAAMTTPGAVDLAGLLGRMKANGVSHVAMEVSSHALHQHRVGGIRFAVGMFTNLTGDHLDYHKTMDEYAAAKAMLFESLAPDASAVINVDDAYASRMVRDCRSHVVGVSLERRSDAAWYAQTRSMTAAGMVLEIQGPGGEDFELRTPLVGKHNVYNLLVAVAGARAAGLPSDAVLRGLTGNAGAPGRLQAVTLPGVGRAALPMQVFVDYAHTHDALANVLAALRATMGQGRLICVFGCGGDRDRTKRPKMAAEAERGADVVVVTSDNPRTEDPAGIIDEILAGFTPEARSRVLVEADRRAAIRAAIGQARRGDVVLIAGKGHENYQIIGTSKTHFDDVEEAQAALQELVGMATPGNGIAAVR